MASLFGDITLVHAASGDRISAADHLAGKDVLLYFSASWCGPCHKFTPLLVEWYKSANRPNNVEVVFIPVNEEEGPFKKYHEKMPWPAVHVHDSDLIEQFSDNFQVDGVPTLIAVGADGSVITKDGVGKVMKAPSGYPWAAKPLSALIADDTPLLTTNSSQPKSFGELRKTTKTFAVYFSAHWCPPCRGFTPVLVDLYPKLKALHPDMEVVFASSDRDEASFVEYFGEMPWTSIPLGHPAKDALSEALGVKGIPTLVVLNSSDLSVVERDARRMASADKDGSMYPWVVPPPPPVITLSPHDENAMDALRSGAAGIALHVGDAKDASELEAAFKNHVTPAAANAKHKYFVIPRKSEKERDRECCNAGHKLEAKEIQPGRGMRCDACGTDTTAVWHGCRQCNEDLCDDCYQATARIPEASESLFRQLCGMTRAGEAPRGPSLFVFALKNSAGKFVEVQGTDVGGAVGQAEQVLRSL
jgi:nucleoredoxin